MFTPSRPAPIPTPSMASATPNSLPPHHPFASYHVPMLHLDTSSASLTSFEIQPTPRLRPLKYDSCPRGLAPRSLYAASAASCYSTDSSDYRSYLLPTPRTSTSPTGNLASPLTPGRPRVHPSHFSTPPSTRANSSPLPSPTSSPGRIQAPPPAYSTIHTDLAVLDRRGRQDLLTDLEFIAGKKLRFPFLRRWTGEQEQVKKEKRVLRKERRESQEEEFGWEVEELLKLQAKEEKGCKRAGRGVREGNWI